MNKVHIIGRLTADPSLRNVNGISCTDFTVAADTRSKDKEGNPITNFWRVSAWRSIGENCAKYLHKGDRVAVVGDVVLQTYTDTNGNWRASMQVTADNVEFLMPSKREREQEQTAATSPPPTPAAIPNESSDDLPF